MMELCLPEYFYNVKSVPVAELDVCTLAAYISLSGAECSQHIGLYWFAVSKY